MKSVFYRLTQMLLGFTLVLLGSSSYAQTVSGLVTHIQGGLLQPLLQVIVAISYLAGAGFIVAAIFKFKAHKDNPTQVTVGTPIMLLFVGIGLLFFPVLVTDVQSSLGFGSGSGGSINYSGGSITS